MREDLVEILAEPSTGARLKLKATRGANGRVEEGELVSEQTGAVYPIVRGIPRFVPAENYSATFGFQWNKFRQTQIDTATGADHSRQRFDDETGWTERDLAGKLVLDAGCGAGRFAEVAAQRGSRLVALDLSSAVEAAKQTLAPYPNADVVQGSLLTPPFRPGTFDFAYCLGVVQHTPDPQGAVATVAGMARPGGQFAFAIYARRPWTKLNAKYLIRPLTRRLPNDLLLGAIERSMPIMFPLTDKLFRLPVVGKVAQFTIPVANYVDKDGFTREQRYEEAILDTFDMLSPRYDSPMTWSEVERALRETRAQSWAFKSRVPIVCGGVR